MRPAHPFQWCWKKINYLFVWYHVLAVGSFTALIRFATFRCTSFPLHYFASFISPTSAPHTRVTSAECKKCYPFVRTTTQPDFLTLLLWLHKFTASPSAHQVGSPSAPHQIFSIQQTLPLSFQPHFIIRNSLFFFAICLPSQQHRYYWTFVLTDWKSCSKSKSRPLDCPEISIMVSFALGNDTNDTKS